MNEVTNEHAGANGHTTAESSCVSVSPARTRDAHDLCRGAGSEVSCVDREVVARSRTLRTTPSAAPAAARQTAYGCSRCGSTCTLLDDCAVCSGVTLCARCLFGSRVEKDEAHTVLALEG
jgi:hypothetical protein